MQNNGDEEIFSNNFDEMEDEIFEDLSIDQSDGDVQDVGDTIVSLDDSVAELNEIIEDEDYFSTGDYVIINLVETWKEQQIADRGLKSKYGIGIMIILGLEFIFMGAILVFIGLEKLIFDEWVINAFIVTTFGQIMGVVYLIVKHLFSDGNQIIDIIKEYIK